MIGGSYVRTAIILFFIGNEGLSIVENGGLMGIPYPAFLKNALEAIKDKGDKGESKDAYSAPQVRIFDGEVQVMENSLWKSLGSIDALAAADPFLGFSAPAALQESDGVNRDGGKVPVYVPPAAQSAGGGSSGDTGGSTPAAPPSSGEWTPDVL